MIRAVPPERRFVAVALLAVVLVTAPALPAVASGQATAADRQVSFDADVPAEFSFTAPTADGTARVDGTTYDSLQAAVDAADPGDTVVITGRFDERVTVDTPNLTVTSAPGTRALLNGTGEGDVLTLNGANATLRGVWVANSGFDPAGNDAGIWVNATGAVIQNVRVTEVTFGIWVDGVNDVRLVNNTIVGRERIETVANRGNGIQLWKTDGTTVADNRITDVRDGIYYSWVSDTTASGNVVWDVRYGVHYMYSDHNRLLNNTVFDNDVGYALMMSEDIRVDGNTAVNNTGTSGHGLLLKRIDHSTVTNNSLVGNGNGVFVYNAMNNTIAGNLVLANDVGVHLTAGSFDERVYDNSFIDNREDLYAVTSTTQVRWNTSESGNYWSQARTSDVNDDGVSELRYRPAGVVEQLVRENPAAAVFAHSPAFDAVRMAEHSFPVVHAPGVIDAHPLTTTPHDNWRRFYGDTQR